METDPLKVLWCREQTEGDEAGAVSREDLAKMVQERANEVTTRMRQRLKKEIGYYLIVLAATALPSVVSDFRPVSLGIAAALALVVGGIMATLQRGSRQLAALNLDGAAGEALHRALRIVDATMRSYLIGYVLCVAVGVGMVVALVMIWHPGDLRWIVPTLIAAALATVWSYSSGRAYLRHHFGRYHDELARCLTTLEGA